MHPDAIEPCKSKLPASTGVFYKLIKDLEFAFSNAASSDTLMQQVSLILKSFGKHGLIAKPKTLINDPIELKKIANNSYFQGNGFYKIPLYQGKKFSIRFHLYTKDHSAEENLHSHRWWFASLITDGYLSTEIWEDSALPEATQYREIFYMGKNSEFIAAGETSVERVKHIIYNSGDTYICPTETLHRVLVNNCTSMTATLICKANSGRSWSRNIVVNDHIPTITPTYIEESKLIEIINNYIDHSI